jgi:C-terminal processing protease CtpA/Prc
MKPGRFGAVLSVAALLSACGGGGGGGGTPTPTPIGTVPTPGPSPSPTPTAGCSVRARQDWVAAQMREWYLFPETLPASLDPTPFSTVDAYLDALTATARSQRRDRFFTYLTSIKEEDAFFQSGASAGFGVRLAYDSAGRRLLVSEAFEGAPALNAGIDRGTEILAIGTSEANLRNVSDIFAAEGAEGVNNALGPTTAGITRTLRISNAAGTRVVTVTKAEFTIPPVSARYGARIIDDGGKRVGYVNLRTFISTANPALRQAFADFRAQGITEVIVDFRYNGGGLVSVAELMGDLLGGNRSPTQAFSFTTFRPEKASNNETRNFRPQPQSISSTKIAFIGTGGSASASELVINSFIPYLRANAALVGTNTFGKPVGQIALDKSECDDRLRVVAFRTENADRQGDYFDGLASKVEASCQAGDDLTRQLGDPQEGSTRQALDFLAGRSCTRISTGISAQSARAAAERRDLLTPQRPTPAQREVPGLF